MDEEQEYLFDLFGFIVVREVLTQEQISKLRSTIRGGTEQFPPVPQSEGPLHWDVIWRDLLDLPVVSSLKWLSTHSTSDWLRIWWTTSVRGDEPFEALHRPAVVEHGFGIDVDAGDVEHLARQCQRDLPHVGRPAACEDLE